jgi:hypothetical protein
MVGIGRREIGRTWLRRSAMAMDLFPIRMGLVITSVVGLSFLSLAMTKAREAASLHRRSSKTQGRIVGWEDGWWGGGEDSEPAKCQRARVRFSTVEGREITFLSEHISFEPRNPNGGLLTVWYPRDDPKAARVGSFARHWTEVGLFLTFGLLALAMAGGLLYANFHPDGK